MAWGIITLIFGLSMVGYALIDTTVKTLVEARVLVGLFIAVVGGSVVYYKIVTTQVNWYSQEA